MANRQTYVIGALGVLVGMVVGANSAQRAETVALSAHNPNSDIVQQMPHLRRAAGIIRRRSDEGAVNVFSRITQSRRSPFGEGYIGTIRDNRVHQMPMHGSAPEMSESPRRVVPGCAQYTRKRYVDCVWSLIHDEEYEPNYFPTSY